MDFDHKFIINKENSKTGRIVVSDSNFIYEGKLIERKTNRVSNGRGGLPKIYYYETIDENTKDLILKNIVSSVRIHVVDKKPINKDTDKNYLSKYFILKVYLKKHIAQEIANKIKDKKDDTSLNGVCLDFVDRVINGTLTERDEKIITKAKQQYLIDSEKKKVQSIYVKRPKEIQLLTICEKYGIPPAYLIAQYLLEIFNIKD